MDLFRAGQTFQRTIQTKSEVAPGASVLLRLSPVKGGLNLDIPISNPSGRSVDAIESSTATATWQPGYYDWLLIQTTTGGEVAELACGKLQILPPVLRGEAKDTRSHARKMLEAIEALLEGRATEDVSSIAYNGRQLTKMPMPDLIALHQRYLRLVRAEDDRDNGRKNRILARF